MSEELKIKIQDYKEVEEKLKKLGAKFIEEIQVKDTYFNQPKGEVLKITEDDRGNFLVSLKAENGKFRIIKEEKIGNVKEQKEGLTEKFGVKCILNKKRRFFDFEDYSININLIDDVGEFLIIEGEDLVPKLIIEKFELKNPEFVTVSFDELKQ